MAVRFDSALMRRIAITAGVLAAYRLAALLPLPGLDAEKIRGLMQIGGPVVGRASLMALGVIPLINALMLIEALRLIAPDVRRWEGAAPRNAGRLRSATLLVALLMALFQAIGIATALEGVSGLVPEPGLAFRLTIIATLVGGSAIAIAFAAIIDRAGIGSGVWLLFLAPALAGLPRTFATMAEYNAEGSYPAIAIVLGLLYVAIAIAAVVNILLAARGAASVASAVVWTPIIANPLIVLLLVPFGLLLTSGLDGAVALAQPGYPIWYATAVVAVTLLIWLYARSYAQAGAPMPLGVLPIAASIAAILVAGSVLQSPIGVVLPLNGIETILVATVGTKLLADWGFVHWPAAGSAPESTP